MLSSGVFRNEQSWLLWCVVVLLLLCRQIKQFNLIGDMQRGNKSWGLFASVFFFSGINVLLLVSHRSGQTQKKRSFFCQDIHPTSNSWWSITAQSQRPLCPTGFPVWALVSSDRYFWRTARSSLPVSCSDATVCGEAPLLVPRDICQPTSEALKFASYLGSGRTAGHPVVLLPPWRKNASIQGSKLSV